jgi:hypothetical protein
MLQDQSSKHPEHEYFTLRPVFRRCTAWSVVPLGLLFRMVAGLDPVWWLAWLLPGLLLALALRLPARRATLCLSMVLLLACSASYPYFAKVTNPALAVLLVTGQCLPWLGAFRFARRSLLQEDKALAVLAFPVAYTAIDSLMLRFCRMETGEVFRTRRVIFFRFCKWLMSLAASVSAFY